MLFFGKNTDEEEYEEENSQERLRTRKPKTSEFKDLKPENKKKRKEPKKPWGRKERLLVLLALLITAGGSGILGLSARSWKLPGFPRMRIPSFSLPSFFKEETIVIEGRKKDQEKANRAIETFVSHTKELSGVWGLYVIRLSNGFSYGVNETEVFQAASLIKLPVMAAMYLEEENASFDLEEKYILKSSDKIGGAGSLYSKPVGYATTYRNLIRLMGKQSDNTAFNIARKTLGETKIKEVVTKIGMQATDLIENETTPQDVGTFFEELWFGNILSQKNKDELLEYMTDTSYEAWISKGIPEDVRVSHKYGRETHVVNDAGIIFTKEPFILVILSKGVVETEADKAFPELTKIIYDIEVGD